MIGCKTKLFLLTGQPALFWVSSHMGVWSHILFNLAVIINLIVAFFYPFDDNSLPDPGGHLSGLIWAVMLLSAAIAITLPKPAGIRTLVVTVILRLICSAGPRPTLALLGSITVRRFNEAICLEPSILMSDLFAGGAERDSFVEHHGQCRNVLSKFEANLYGYGDTLSRHLSRLLLLRTIDPSVLLFRLGTYCTCINI